MSLETYWWIQKGVTFETHSAIQGKTTEVFEHLLPVPKDTWRKSRVFAELRSFVFIHYTHYKQKHADINGIRAIQYSLKLYIPERDKNSRWINPSDVRPKKMLQLDEMSCGS